MSEDVIVGILSIFYLAAFTLGRRWLRRRNIVKQRPWWQVYLIFDTGSFLFGLTAGLIYYGMIR